MRNPFFVRGVILGLLLGFVLGHFVTNAVPPPPGSGDGEAERLRHQLETVRRERDGLEKNLAEFQAVAEKMKTAFEALEKRFKALEERGREGGETPGTGPAEP